MPQQGAEFQTFTEPGDASRAMLGMSLNVVPLGGASYTASLATMRLGDAVLHLCRRLTPPSWPSPRRMPTRPCCSSPLEATNSLVLNGMACLPGTIGVCGGGSEFLLANREESAATRPSSFRPGWLAPSLSPPAGSKFWRPGAHALLQANPEAWERARRVIGAAGRAIASIPQVFEAEQPRRALREALFQATRDLVSGQEESTEICAIGVRGRRADASSWRPTPILGSTGTARSTRKSCATGLRYPPPAWPRRSGPCSASARIASSSCAA